MSRLIEKSCVKKKYVCRFCLSMFMCESQRQEHMRSCKYKIPQTVSLPAKDKALVQFKENFSMVQCVIVCDTEASLVPNANNNKISHVMNSYSFVRICFDNPVFNGELKYYIGEKAAEKMIEDLEEEAKVIKLILEVVIPLEHVPPSISSSSDPLCGLCKKKFEEGEKQTLHHNHLTGKFICRAHNSCNLKARQLNTNKKGRHKVLVFQHNSNNYDLHFILRAANKRSEIDCIADTKIKFKCLTLGNLKFLDSYMFIKGGLSKLVSSLKESSGIKAFPITKHYMKHFPKLEILLRKGVYPYDMITSVEVLKNTVSLPEKCKFFNALSNAHITDADYAHAMQIWVLGKMKSMMDYHKLYLQLDVVLLCDVLCNFRKVIWNTFRVEPFHHISLSGVGWSAMLKHTKISLELLTDIDVHLFFENAIRGGISQACHKFCKSNNPAASNYNPCEPISSLCLLDVNALYPHTMKSFPLPFADFKFLNEEQIELFDVESVSEDSSVGYFLEADLEIPHHLHDYFNDLPILPEKIKVDNSMLSEHTLAMKKKLGYTKCKDTVKLACTLFNKVRYSIHYRNLQLCLKLGIRITKVHRILQFAQNMWLAPFIEKCSTERVKAHDEFESTQIKFVQNSVFGKSLQSSRKYVHIKFATSKKLLLKYTSSPHFVSCHILNKNLVLVCSKRKSVVLNSPIYLGCAILELSKYYLFDLLYNKLKPAISPLPLTVNYVDTDSLLIYFQGDIFQLIESNPWLFDCSNFSKDHKLYSTSNRRVTGLLKSETGNRIILEYVGLKSKMYSLLCEDGFTKKACKGVNSSFALGLRHDVYKHCLFASATVKTECKQIAANAEHEVNTISVCKISLSAYDDKRYVFVNPMCNTRALGHFLNDSTMM